MNKDNLLIEQAYKEMYNSQKSILGDFNLLNNLLKNVKNKNNLAKFLIEYYGGDAEYAFNALQKDIEKFNKMDDAGPNAVDSNKLRILDQIVPVLSDLNIDDFYFAEDPNHYEKQRWSSYTRPR